MTETENEGSAVTISNLFIYFSVYIISYTYKNIKKEIYTNS